MSYNLIYTGSFDVQQSAEPFLSIKVDIFKKDYVGAEQTIILTGTPIVHEWQDDDPFAPIKGSTCKIGIINDGTISLDDFYSDEDDTFGIEVKRVETDEVLFAGYILQDDCREIQVDFAHEILITATDNLGLLKEVSLGEAAKLYGTPTSTGGVSVYSIAGNFNTICSFNSLFGTFQVGDIFYITSGTLQGYWTVTQVTIHPTYGYYVNVAEQTVTYTPAYSTTITYNIAIDLTGYVNLLTIIRLCFLSTQLQISGFSCVSTLIPSTGSTGRWLEDTYISPNTFKREGLWLNCYDILEQLMSRFKASAFQAYGRWWVVRWGELYMQADNISTMGMVGTNYNANFEIPTATTYTDYSFSLLHNDIEYGWEKAIDRPIKYAREQFDYIFPTSPLLNADLSELGAIVQDQTVGSIRTTEYELPYWVAFSDNPSPTVSEKRIRVVRDLSANEELERYAFIKGQPYSNETALQSNNIEVSAGDVITYSFDVSTENVQIGGLNLVFSVWINDGINPTKKLNNNGQWGTGGTFVLSIPSPDGSQNWHNVTITSDPIPYDAVLRCFLASCCIANPGDNVIYESRYRNFSFTIQKPDDYLRYAIGHVHKDTNTLSIKNNTDLQIFVDDSPRSSISGTLFEEGTTGTVRNRTSSWEYDGFPGLTGRLGYLTTIEQMMINYTARSLYYGSILKIWHGTEDDIKFISNFFVFNVLNSGDNRRFVPGNLAIDYKHNRADITLHQLTEWQETSDDVDDFYTFNYLYENG